MLHDLLDLRGYVSELGMVHPVSGGIGGEREVSYRISVDFVIQLKEDTEASMCKDDVRSFGDDVIE